MKKFILFFAVTFALSACSHVSDSSKEQAINPPSDDAAVEADTDTQPMPVPEADENGEDEKEVEVIEPKEDEADEENEEDENKKSSEAEFQKPKTDPQPATQPQQAVKTFSLTAKTWEFLPSEIRVKKGDAVVLNITSVDVDHGFALPDFNVKTDLKPNTTVQVKFTADKTGTFTFFCSEFCGSGHSSMKGKLIVE